MKILIAPDSMKDCLSAREVASIIASGISKISPDFDLHLLPFADGGEGTAEVIISATKGKFHLVEVMDPLMRPITAKWGSSGDGKTAIIELASASGIERLKEEERNPWHTTTYGTGQLINEALNAGVKRIMLTLGGSATNDGGAGILNALGATFLDNNKNPVHPAGGYLNKIIYADFEPAIKKLNNIKITIACDVNNPLTGPEGSSSVYGPQKGADPEMVKKLDQNLQHWANLLKAYTNKEIHNIPGSGAAGGAGCGLIILPQTRLISGFDLISETLNLEKHIAESDLIITAEGKTDRQTLSGKVPVGIGLLAKKYQKPVLLFCGKAEDDLLEIYNSGISAVVALSNNLTPTSQAIKETPELLKHTTETTLRIFLSGIKAFS